MDDKRVPPSGVSFSQYDVRVHPGADWAFRLDEENSFAWKCIGFDSDL